MAKGKLGHAAGEQVLGDLENWRKGLIRGVFRGATAFGAVAVAIAYFATRTRLLSYFYIGIYLAFLLVTFLRLRSFRLQAWACLALLYGLGALALFEDGLTGDGRVFMLTLPVLAALLLGGQAGLISLGVALLTMAGFGAAYGTGLLTIPAQEQLIANDIISWASGTAAWLVMGIVAVLSLNHVLTRFTSAIEDTRRLTHELQAHQEDLENQVAERTKALEARGQELAAQANTLKELVETQRGLLRTIRDMSTPVVPLQAGIIIMPLVGLIDAERARQVSSSLLTGIESHQARAALVDITGVPVVDATVAQALVEAMRAARLLGAEPILVGLSPEVAHTLVTLGVEMGDLATCGDLQQGLELASHYAGRQRAKSPN